MRLDTQKVVEEALHLPRPSRAFLVEKLLESLDGDDDFQVSPEWMVEIRRRCEEIDHGVVRLIPSSQVFDEVDCILG